VAQLVSENGPGVRRVTIADWKLKDNVPGWLKNYFAEIGQPVLDDLEEIELERVEERSQDD
jgi:hypothetical protein